MFHDFAARGLAAQNRRGAHRLATIDTLARGIAENLPRGLPGVMDTPIDENRANATQITSGVTYGFHRTTASSDFGHKFSFYGGDWSHRGATYPDYVTMRGLTNTFGNGTDPTASPASGPGVSARFSTWADSLEILAVNYLGFRVRVNGLYTQDGMYGVSALNSDTQSNRFFLFDFSETEFAGLPKHVEVIGGGDFRFQGARVPTGYTIEPLPGAALKCCLHGDSKVASTSDSGNAALARHGTMPEIMQVLTGIADIRYGSLGGCGFLADMNGTRSDFLEQASVDFAVKNYDVVWEAGGFNDPSLITSADAYRDLVVTWIDAVLTGNPDAIIILTGLLPSGTGSNYSAGGNVAAVQDAKKAAAALRPLNCAFIETMGNATHPGDGWISGTGKQGATTGNGNADGLTGPDGVHPTIVGAWYQGHRLVAETAKVLPLLASRIRDGVIAGVNDLDLR